MQHTITADGLEVRLGDFTALSGIGFHLPTGSTLAIVGPNGAGKSTLVKVLLGLIQPATGSVSVLGKPPAQADARRIGYVPQVKSIERRFPAITCEMVASGLLRRWPVQLGGSVHQQVDRALQLVGIAHLSHQPVNWLSGGELQRVYLARALVRGPQLLLLDEPATGIDAVGEDDMYEYIEHYQGQTGCTVAMVTHDWLAAEHHASHVLLLNRRQISFGPPVGALSQQHLAEAFSHSRHGHHHVHGGGNG